MYLRKTEGLVFMNSHMEPLCESLDGDGVRGGLDFLFVKIQHIYYLSFSFIL